MVPTSNENRYPRFNSISATYNLFSKVHWWNLARLVPQSPIQPISVAWGNDSQTIYFRAGASQSSLWSVPAVGGPPSHLVQFDDSHNFSRAEFDTDGKDFFSR
jgi:hypothetical protein